MILQNAQIKHIIVLKSVDCVFAAALLALRLPAGIQLLQFSFLWEQSFEALNQRAVAVVVDPIQSVKGKVVIDAFRFAFLFLTLPLLLVDA